MGVGEKKLFFLESGQMNQFLFLKARLLIPNTHTKQTVHLNSSPVFFPQPFMIFYTLRRREHLAEIAGYKGLRRWAMNERATSTDEAGQSKYQSY